MSLTILSNRRRGPERLRLVLGFVLLLSGCARGPRWEAVPKWARVSFRARTPEMKTRRPEDEPAGHATLRRSPDVRSGNVFTAFINRRKPRAEPTDDPFLRDALAQTAVDHTHSADNKAVQTRAAAPQSSSPIRQVDDRTVHDRSRLIRKHASSVARRPLSHRDRKTPATQSSGENIPPATSHAQMNRLQEAMKSDQRGTRFTDQAKARMAKARVGHMMRDVHALRRKGRLSEAYRTALSAKLLARTSHLFYGPDDERPGDLVHQLRQELRAAGHETPVALPSLPVRPSQPAVARRGGSRTRVAPRRPSVKKSLRPLPFPEFTPPDISLPVARKTDRPLHSGRARSGRTASAEQTPVASAAVAVARQTPSERVEILAPAPSLTRSQGRTPSVNTVLKPVLPIQPRVLTNSAPASTVRPVSSNRPVIVPAWRILPPRAKTGRKPSIQPAQPTSRRVRQTSLTTGRGVGLQTSAQPDAVVAEARSAWNRKTEPAVLLPSLLNVPADKASVPTAQRHPASPAPTPPAEPSVANPSGDAGPLPADNAPSSSAAANSGTPSAAVSVGTINWDDPAGLGDDRSDDSRKALLWLALAVATGVLMGVAIRTWRRHREKPVQSRTS